MTQYIEKLFANKSRSRVLCSFLRHNSTVLPMKILCSETKLERAHAHKILQAMIVDGLVEKDPLPTQFGTGTYRLKIPHDAFTSLRTAFKILDSLHGGIDDNTTRDDHGSSKE